LYFLPIGSVSKGGVQVDAQNEYGKLIELTLSGSKDAYGEIYEKTVQDVYQTVHFLLEEKADVDDVVQEVYVQVYKSLSRYDQSKPFQPWLKGIAVKQISAYRRKRWLGFRNTKKVLQQPIEIEKDFSGAVVDKISNKQLVQLVDKLPYKLRQVIILRYLNEHSQEEVAAILKVPIGTVKSRIHSALKKLREHEQSENIFLRKVENI
jgi:RNA polymerase sigma-70 factor, ECF subfamily